MYVKYWIVLLNAASLHPKYLHSVSRYLVLNSFILILWALDYYVLYCVIGSLHVAHLFSWTVFAELCWWVILIYPILTLIIVTWPLVFSGIFHFLIFSNEPELIVLLICTFSVQCVFIFCFICYFNVTTCFPVWSTSLCPGFGEIQIKITRFFFSCSFM